MNNYMTDFSFPSMEDDCDIYDSILEMAGVKVLYLDLGFSFLDKAYRIVYYINGENKNENKESLRDDGRNGKDRPT